MWECCILGEMPLRLYTQGPTQARRHARALSLLARNTHQGQALLYTENCAHAHTQTRKQATAHTHSLKHMHTHTHAHTINTRAKHS